MSYVIDADRKMVVLTGQGVLTDADLVDCVTRMMADPDVAVSMPSLVDIGAVTRLEVTKQGLDAMFSVVRADGSPLSTARIAVVASGASDFMARLLTAMADAEKSGRQYRRFDSADEARSWLLGDG